MDYLVYISLGLSLAANLILGLMIFRQKNKTLTVDAKRLLSEILSGPAIVKIDVIDASQLFLRSPRG
jgi:hypothetical protein